ncbi:hypothetical protein AAF712_006006 [Marasmius tenuissimus]|uniref:Uncharacterized protein n=1 Tax=Marasmius tenuissimus TaxID=585030 RepID=A0ABR3A365_9AGAR|nr:hypothetical protein PM082_004324 [Marasmius tenuissimus]
MSVPHQGTRQIAPLPNRRASVTTIQEDDATNHHEENMEDEEEAGRVEGQLDFDNQSVASKRSDTSQSTFTPWDQLLKSLPTKMEDWPYDFDRDAVPEFQEHNPHLWATQNGERPNTSKYEGPQQMGPLPYVPISLDTLVSNMATSQVNQIMMSIGTPHEIFGFMELGSGYGTNKKFFEARQQAYVATIKSIQHKHEKQPVITRLPEVNSDENQSPYSTPWVMLGQGLGPDSLRHALHQGYIKGPDSTILRIVRFTENDCTEPWTYKNFSPGGLEREHAPLVREAIVMAAVTNRNFQNFAIQNATDLDPNASLEERQEWVMHATCSWNVTVVETGNERNEFYFQLSGHPVKRGRGSHKTMSDILRNIKVMYNFFELMEYTGVLACVWCKSTTHVSATCPLPDTPGWVGPTREELEARGAPKTKKGGPKSKAPPSKDGAKKGKANGGEKKNLKRKM